MARSAECIFKNKYTFFIPMAGNFGILELHRLRLPLFFCEKYLLPIGTRREGGRDL